MKRVISLFCGAAIVALSGAAAVASPPSLTGSWTVQQTGLNGTTSSTITLKQSGDSIVGKNASNGNGFTGTFVSDTKINGKWHGPGGAGWLTVYASENGHSFNGSGAKRTPRKRHVRRQQVPAAVADHGGRQVERHRRGRLERRLRRADDLHGVRRRRSVSLRTDHHQREVPRQGQGPRHLDER